MSRLSEILKEYTGSEDVDDVYLEVLGVLSEGGVPQVGKYYTFVYRPKTPNLRYDEYPLVAFPEIVGGVYNITDEEIDDARNLSFGKYRLNR